MRLLGAVILVIGLSAAITAAGFAFFFAISGHGKVAMWFAIGAFCAYSAQCGLNAVALPGPKLAGLAQHSAGPSPIVVPSPQPGPEAKRFKELAIPAPGGNPYALTLGPDHTIWFTEAECTSGIGSLASDGAWRHWSITGGGCNAQPLAITVGSDGNIWFADVWSSYGRITPDGKMTRFPMPEASYPSGITTGPDGDLWIAAGSPYSKPFIARVGLDGSVVNLYRLSAQAGEPRGIVTGPDGAIWFTESAGIGRVTESGQLNEFPLPQGNASGMPYQIAVGPDRNIWFVEYLPSGEGRIGRMTTSGQLTEFVAPGARGLQWIATGPDNALWFTAAGVIGRISLVGAVTVYPVPTYRAQPVGIVIGPDKNMWFAESLGGVGGDIGVFTVKS